MTHSAKYPRHIFLSIRHIDEVHQVLLLYQYSTGWLGVRYSSFSQVSLSRSVRYTKKISCFSYSDKFHLHTILLSRSNSLSTSAWYICAYSCVVWIFVCPSILLITSILTPLANAIVVAKVCRAT